MVSYFNVVVYISVSFLVGFVATSCRLSSWMLQGLHYYLYPENSTADAQQGTQSGNGSKSMKGKEAENIATGSSVGDYHDSNKAGPRKDRMSERDGQWKRERKRKGKDQFSWEEGSSQILRLILAHSHLHGRLYYEEYDEAVVYSLVGFASLLTCTLLSHFVPSSRGDSTRDTGFLTNDELVASLMGSFGMYKIVRLLANVSWQSGTSRISDLTLSLLVGCSGFFVAFYLLQWTPTSVMDFRFEKMYLDAVGVSSTSLRPEFIELVELSILSSTLAKTIVALIAGCFTSILMAPAHRSVRSFWLGTDQLQWNIPVLRMAFITRSLLHLNMILPLFAAMIWIKPMGEIFLAPKAMVKELGLTEEIFRRVQLWSLLAVGLLQLCLFRVNVQAYLNEGLVVWYESLHRSKSMNLELTRAKLLLNSYCLCRVAVQFVAPGMGIILLLGMARVWESWTAAKLVESSATLLYLRGIALFLAWWLTFSWMVLSCSVLALYRIGFFLAT